MTDPVTPNLSFTLPQVGGDNGVWGGYLNTDITNIDTAFGGNQSLTVTSADVTITNPQFSNAIFTVTGGLTGNRNLFVPISPNSTTAAGIACGGRFVVVNNTSNAYSLTVKTTLANSSGVVVPQGGEASLYSDGLNVLYSNRNVPGAAIGVNGNPTGQISGIAGSANTNVDLAYDYTNNNIYACTVTGSSSSATWAQPVFTILRGFDTAVNLQLSASVAANILTVNAYSAALGAAPTATSPIIFPMNVVSSNYATGAPVNISATSALSISTFATGATLGSSNGAPFRFWIVVFNNGGTPVLGLINCSTASPRVYPLNETGVASSTAMTGGATSAGVFYTPNGTAVANCAFRIIGFLSYEGGLVTAGTYNNAPTLIQLFGPGVKKPGDVIQTVYATDSSSVTVSGTANTKSNTTVSISPTSAVNLVSVASNFSTEGFGGAATLSAQISRGTSPTLIGNVAISPTLDGTSVTMPVAAIDTPGTTSTTAYYVYFKSTVSNGGTSNQSGSTSMMVAQEVMG